LKPDLPPQTQTRPVPLVLAGFGHVGRAFFSLAQDKKDYLLGRYGLDLDLRAIFKAAGGFISDTGITTKDIPAEARDLPRSPLWMPGAKVEAGLRKLKPGVFVECTPSDIQTGEPGLTYIRTALKAGWHVVTADKGPLVVDLKGLQRLAKKNHLALKYSAAAAAALPTLDTALHSLAGAEILCVEGILNGTTNTILTRMGEGAAYLEALKEAQEKGIAEPDPRLDVEGWDTAVKILLIGNSVLGLDLALGDIKVEGVTRLPPELPTRARQEGKAIKLMGRLVRSGGRWEAVVSPQLIERSHPLFGVNETNKGISYTTDTMGTVTVTGGKSDPRGAAAALLKDIIHIFARVQ
jgi:homoserine dehydrogenase